MTDYTIANEYILPSHGKVYTQEVKPEFKLRSMTTKEEMKRLNHSERQNKILCDIIDECLLEDIGISSYDLCSPDFQYMLHKLRVVTYGPEYKLSSRCPWCGTDNNNIVNLDTDLNFVEFDEEVYHKYSTFTLPVTKKSITIKMQTPRMLDNIQIKIKEEKKRKSNLIADPTLMVTLSSMIDTVDGAKLEEFRMEPFIEKLPMMDTNYIIKAALKLNSAFGLESSLEHVCSYCGLDYTGNFRTTSEFFGPSID